MNVSLLSLKNSISNNYHWIDNGMYYYDLGCLSYYYSSRMRMSVRPFVDADDSNFDFDDNSFDFDAVDDDVVVVGTDLLVHDIDKMNH